jgi:argininosuccinate lyase
VSGASHHCGGRSKRSSSRSSERVSSSSTRAGRAVRLADDRGAKLWDLPLPDLQAIDPRIDKRIFDVLTVEASVRSRTSYGGTAPQAVRRRIEAAKKALGMNE